MSMSSFPHGTIAASIEPSPRLRLTRCQASHVAALSATAQIRVTNTGLVQIDSGSGFVSQRPGIEWVDDVGAIITTAYTVRITGSGTTPSGSAINVYLDLGTTRTWTLTVSGSGLSAGFSGTIEIREDDNPSNSVSAPFSISVAAT